MMRFAHMPTIDVWYPHVDVEQVLLRVKKGMDPSGSGS